MGFFDTVARLTITEVFKAGLAEVNSRLNPDEIIMLLQQAEVAADAAQPELGGLFRRIDRDGANGYQKFLKFFQSGEVLTELQKPLKNCGKPDVNILVKAFNRSALEYPDVDNYLSDLMPLWIKTFVESYFERVKGICFQVAKEQYLKQLARRVDDVKFVGIAVPGEEVEKQEVLAQIFVMPDVREERKLNLPKSFQIDFGSATFTDELTLPFTFPINETKQNKLLAEQKALAMRDRSSPRIPAPKILNLSRKKAVVLGAPGSGKTMLVSYFALMLCETAQSDPTQIGLETDADYLPLVVRIRDWILQPNMGLLEYLRSNAEASLACKELPAGFFEHWLDRGRALILLDGVDEVVDEAQRSKVAEKIVSFLHQYKDNPAVITSRPAGSKGLFKSDEFPHYTLESFDDKQVATFIDHWYDSRLKEDPAQAERRKADLQKAFARNERIRLLAKNPLLLTIITLIHRYQAELPRQRCKLYEKAVETLLTSWDSGKEIKLYSQVLQHLKSDDLLYILKKLAYWIHTQGSTGETEGGTLIDKDELIRWLRKEIQTLKKCEAHEAKGEAERFIDFIQRRTGLLNEQGRDRYAFVHKTFQEYLTAEEIYDLADVEDDTEIILDHFRRHLHDQHWREVLLLLVSKLKGKKAQKAIQAVLDGGSEYEQWLHRDLLFAGWCLTEDPPELTVVAADWVGGILDRLVDLEVSDSDRVGEKVKHEVEKIIHCFGETTIEGDVWRKLRDRGSLIASFRLLEFQAYLGQESEAIYLLLSSLQHENGNIRAFAAEVLGKLGKSNPAIENGLLYLLNDEHLLARAIAATVLVQLGHVSPELVEILVSLFKNEHFFLHSIAEVLVQLRDFSSAVEQVLFFLLKDENWLLRSRAASTLGKFGNVSSAAVESLLSLLKDEDSVVRSSAAAALSQSGNISSDVFQVLLSSIEDENSFARSNAIKALGQMENASSVVEESLLFLLKDEDQDPFARSLTASALIQLGNSSSELEKRLISLLKDETSHIQSSAAESLALLSKTSDSILPEVVQWLEQNRDKEVMGGAIDCLWSIVVE